MPKRGIATSSPKDFEPKRKNTISLGSDSNIDNDFKAFKIGDVPTGLEFKLGEIRSTADNFVTLKETTEQLTVTKIKGGKSGSVEVPQVIMQHPDATDTSLGLWFNIMTTGTSIIQAGATDTDIVLKASRNLFLYTGEDDGDAFYIRRGSEWLSGYTTALKFDTFNTDLHIYDKTNANDYFKIDVGAEGATTISTVDADTTVGHLTLDVDGSIILDPADGKFIAKKNGTEFSAADSAYAGMILGYTRIANNGTGSTDAYIVMDATLTVLQTVDASTNVSIAFVAPPSGNVEIVFSCSLFASSKTIEFALSDNSTYNEISETHTYDGGAQSSDETDINMTVVSWAVTGLTAGTSYTYYIAGAETISGTAFIKHGRFRSSGAHFPPIIVKAIALPATIVTGG